MITTRKTRRSLVATLSVLALGILSRGTAGQVASPDPLQEEVCLPCAPGWTAFDLYTGEVGIWTVGSYQLFPQYGCPEVVGLDDQGHCTILVSYSGKWTPFQTVEDRAWLGGLEYVDLDPRIDGAELYTGGRSGNLYQIVSGSGATFDTTVIARFPGLEIHTLVAGDLLPSRPGRELLVFTGSGEVFDLRPDAGHGRGFTTHQIAKLPGRVRQAVLLPSRDGSAPRLAGVLRAGRVMLLRMTGDGLETAEIAAEPMGFGRIARRPVAEDAAEVLYVTRDDGPILRLEERADGTWGRELIYAGPQGPRGIVAGRFDADPAAETVAVFGYSAKVQLLTRRPDRAEWEVETIFTDSDKGHWLSVAELDGRNATDEILGSGYAGRIFMLARPPGFGLSGVATDPDPAPREGDAGKQPAEEGDQDA